MPGFPPAVMAQGSDTQPLLAEAAPRSYDATNTFFTHKGSLIPTPSEDVVKSKEDQDAPSAAVLLGRLSGVAVLCFFGAIDATLVATLAGPIATSFNDLQIVSWLQSCFFLANMISQPLTGRATDRFGRRAGIMFGSSLFTVGNIICAAANSVPLLIFGRVIAGLGGGCLGPVATFCIGDMVPLRSRGIYIATLNTFFSVGGSLGGPLGGVINDSLGWRWAFWIQVPPSLVAMALCYTYLHIPNEPAKTNKHDDSVPIYRQLDIAGAILLGFALTLFVLGASTGGNLLPWSHPLVVGAICMTFVFLGLFIWVELRTPVPILPVTLLLNPTVMASCITLFFCTMARYGFFFYGPIFFLAKGRTATETGLRWVPESVSIAIGSFGAGTLMRLTGRYYWLQLTLTSILVATFAVVTCTFSMTTPEWLPFCVTFFEGMAYAGVLATTLLGNTSAVAQKDQAVVTSVGYVFRSSGSVLSIVTASAVFQNLLRTRLNANLGSMGEDAADWIESVRDSLEVIQQLPHKSWRVAAILSYVQALRGVWVILLGFTLCAFTAAIIIKEHKLHSKLDRSSDDEDEQGKA